MSNLNSILETEASRDPVTGALPSQPLGAATSASVGALVGGFAGRGAAESANPTREDAFWLENFNDRPYVDRGSSFDDYGPAYGFGVAAHRRYPGRRFDEVELDLARDWSSARGDSSLSWDAAKHAVRDAWERVGDAGAERSQGGP